jgi:hypothetical protein
MKAWLAALDSLGPVNMSRLVEVHGVAQSFLQQQKTFSVRLRCQEKGRRRACIHALSPAGLGKVVLESHHSLHHGALRALSAPIRGLGGPGAMCDRLFVWPISSSHSFHL